MTSTKAEINLETRLVGSIRGTFFVPSYQRGYRWEYNEVIRLLDDIYNNKTNKYCLQPIVVRRKSEDVFELIDGQQRLSTLYLIYKYMNDTSGGFLPKPRFSIIYETRAKSEEFLKSVDSDRRDENIDFWFMCEAYETIGNWFDSKDKVSTLTKINEYFDDNVVIIWYEVHQSEDAAALFTRLNIGKIPLTSAELVKAMFLSRANNLEMNRKKQEEISLQWDNIERQLHDDSLWYFLTNQSKAQYQTRIDLILDLLANKPVKNKEKYFTFFYFDELKKKENLNAIWKTIQHTFLILKDWYDNHELYHKIGYLIASKTKSLQDIFILSRRKIDGRGITKNYFKSELDRFITDSLNIWDDYLELSYEKKADYDKLSRLLLLFNIESVRQNGEHTQWFPFEKFKFQDTGKVSWTLEHIHAQQSEGMRKEEDWKEWLRLHIPAIVSLNDGDDELIEEMKFASEKTRLERNEFENIQDKVLRKLSVEGSAEYMHSIGNLALLNMSDNAALSNSTFDVKRHSIIEMDKRGQFIPICTKMVFLKYYTPSASKQLRFWGQQDRIAYITAISSTLEHYFAEEISFDEETE